MPYQTRRPDNSCKRSERSETSAEVARRVQSTEHIGLGMVILGILMLVWSLLRYRHVNHHILVARLKPSRFSVIALTVAITLTGAATTVYLMLT